MVLRSLLGLIFVSLTAGCSPSSATFATRYPTTAALDSSIARGAARAGCRAETSFRGPQIVCPDDKSVQLKSRDGFYEAECSGMSRGECEQLLEKVVGATAGG